MLRSPISIDNRGVLPLRVFPAHLEPLTPQQAARWTWALLGLGIASRLVRFGLRFPLWYDEAALSANFLERGYLDFFQPLECGQACPLLYLWLQVTLVKLFGFSEYTLRLFPLLCGLGSLFLFRRLACQLLHGTAAVIAVGVFCASYPAIRYAAEGKPYGTDLFVSLALIALAVQWTQRPDQRRWLWILALAMPMAVGISFPSVFVAGAISLFVAFHLGRRGAFGSWASWVALNVLLLAGFAGTMAVARSNLTEHSVEGMQLYWEDGFPPLRSPTAMAKWIVTAHTGELVAHPVGGKRGASTVTFLAMATAAVVLWRRERPLLILLLGPAALNFVAAAMGRYPYGGHVRLAMHLAPVVCLLMGLGLSTWLAWMANRWPSGRPGVIIALTVLALLPAGAALRDFHRPARSENDLRCRDFARWFWVNRAFDAELACVKSDFRQGIGNVLCLEGDEAIYLCNQRMYSPRHARGEPLNLERVSEKRPLRCARFKAAIAPQDEAGFQRWLTSMESRFRLVDREVYQFPFFEGRQQEVRSVNTLEIYEFVPALRVLPAPHAGR